jgi:hypothetical protein
VFQSQSICVEEIYEKERQNTKLLWKKETNSGDSNQWEQGDDLWLCQELRQSPERIALKPSLYYLLTSSHWRTSLCLFCFRKRYKSDTILCKLRRITF